MLDKIAAGLLTKDQLDRCASALERIAQALEQHLPPIIAEELPKLQEADYRPASDMATLIEESYRLIEQKEGPFDEEKAARVRAFLLSQFNL